MKRRPQRRKFLVLAGSLALLSGCSFEESTGRPGFAATPSSADEPALHFQRGSVMDGEGFGYEAFAILIPKGWAFDPDLNWTFPGGVPIPRLGFTVRSPDGGAIVEHYPAIHYVWTTDQMLAYGYQQQGMSLLSPMRLEEYFRSVYLPEARKGVERLQVNGVRPMPEEAERHRRMNEYLINQVFHSISPFAFPPQFAAEAALIESEFVLEGRSLVETFLVVVNRMTSRMPGAFGAVVTEHWSVDVTAFRVDRSKAAEMAEILPVMMRSAQANPRWLVDSTRLAATLTRQALQHQQAIFQRMRRISETQSEISDMIVDSYRRRSQAMDRIFENYSQAVRGVDTFRDPSRDMNPVELPLGYDQVWTDGSDFILTNDPAFDPTRLSRGHWSRMERVDR